MICLSLLSTLIAIVSAESASDSTAGEHLMSQARALNDQNYQHAFLSKLSIKFDSCHTIHSWADAEAEGGGGQEGGRTPNRAQHLVKYSLCPSGNGCDSCSGGGEYVADIRNFIEIYTQAKQEMQEAQCEAVENSCNCNYYNGDDQACLAGCYSKAGLDFCGQDQNQFDVNEYLDCVEADFGNYYNSFYIGPVCSSNGKAIHLQLFTDASCTNVAPENTYERYHYNYPLPYSQKSIVDDTCISCANDDGNNNNNKNYYQYKYAYYQKAYYQNQEPSEMCEELYDVSAKCERKLEVKNSYARDSGACDYIHKVLPALEKVYKKNGGGGGKMAIILAVFFAISTFGACVAAYYFHREVERISYVLSEAGKEGTYAKF